MLWNPSAQRDRVTSDELTDLIMNRPTPALEYLSAFGGDAFDFSLPGTWYNTIKMPDDDVTGDLDPARVAEFKEKNKRSPSTKDEIYSVLERTGAHVMNHDEWIHSPYYREGIPFDSRMTVARAKAKADEFDSTAYNRWLRDNREMSASTIALAVAGGVLGTGPDPTNYIPFFGPAFKAVAGGRLAAFAARATQGALEASVATALVDASIITSGARAQYGDDLSWADAMLDVALAGTVGGLFGGVVGIKDYNPRTGQQAIAAINEMAKAFDAGREVPVKDFMLGFKEQLMRGSTFSDIPYRAPSPYTPTKVGRDEAVITPMVFEPEGVARNINIPVTRPNGEVAVFPSDTLGWKTEIKKTIAKAEAEGRRVEQVTLADGSVAIAEPVEITRVQSFPTLEFAENALKRIPPDERHNYQVIPDENNERALLVEGLTQEQADYLRLNPNALTENVDDTGLAPEFNFGDQSPRLDDFADIFRSRLDRLNIPAETTPVTPQEKQAADAKVGKPAKTVKEKAEDYGINTEEGGLDEAEDVQRLMKLDAVPAYQIKLYEAADEAIKKANDIAKALEQAAFCANRNS